MLWLQAAWIAEQMFVKTESAGQILSLFQFRDEIGRRLDEITSLSRVFKKYMPGLPHFMALRSPIRSCSQHGK
jgi:hypothetical protein